MTLRTFPTFEDVAHQSPSGFHLIATSEQGRITPHRIEDETFVGFRRRHSERSPVAEVHFDLPDLNIRPGDLYAQAKRDSFVGLDVDDERVGRDGARRRLAKQVEGRPAKLDANFGAPLGKPLSRAQKERHPRPAPALDVQANSYVRLRTGIRRNSFFLCVS